MDISRNRVIKLQRLVNLKFIGHPGTLGNRRPELMLQFLIRSLEKSVPFVRAGH